MDLKKKSINRGFFLPKENISVPIQMNARFEDSMNTFQQPYSPSNHLSQLPSGYCMGASTLSLLLELGMIITIHISLP